MSEKLTDEIRAKLAPGFADLPTKGTSGDRTDMKECAYIELHGATERLLMVPKFRSDHNYSLAMEVVERAIAQYRTFQ